MVLLSVALINYMYRNDTKSMMFLMGSICIVFSEIIQLAYFYVMDDKMLGFIYSFFLVVAFIFFYLQSQLEFTGPEPEYSDEQLEA
jgi:cbb3-type cytochrome oxidase subunit 3